MTKRYLIAFIAILLFSSHASAANFNTGDRVRTTVELWARNDHYTSENKIWLAPKESTGVIIGGPENGSNYTWWRIRYDVGVEGWSAEGDASGNFLELYSPQYTVADNFQYPLIGTWSVSQDFGGWNSNWGGYHLAEDALANAYTPVYTSANGKVRFASTSVGGYGSIIIIEHRLSDNSYICTLYGHLSRSKGLQVSAGQTVSKGQLIGYIGDSTENGGSVAHIHFGIRKGGYSTESNYCGYWLYVGYSQSCTGCTHVQYRDMWHDPTDFVTSHQNQQTLSVSLTAQPSSGSAPLTVDLTADVSGTATGTINYTFWWNCNDPSTSVSYVSSVCGDPWNSTYGAKFDGVLDDPKTINHIYSAPGTYSAKVIAERGSAPPDEKRVTITVNAPSDTTPPTISAFSVSPPSTVTLGQGFTVSYTVSDSGGSHLKQVELWRANVDGTVNDPSWAQIGSAISLSGDGPSSGSFPIDIPTSAGTYWYGIDVWDNAGNWNDEKPNSIKVTVTPQVGSLKVNISPQGAIDAGAKWRRMGTTTWHNTGDTESSIPIGSYTVEFKNVPGWTTPANQNAQITNGKTTTASGTYKQQTGNLKVTLEPTAAVSAGAKWRIDSGAWQNSGDTVTGLSVGTHTVNYTLIAGWDAPADQNVTIKSGQTTDAKGVYTPRVATPTITPNGGTFTSSVKVTMDCNTAGATIRYTTDGSDPTNSSTAYSSPFTLTSSATVKARAFKSGYNTSAIAAAGFTINKFGSLKVTISPKGTVSAEAKWRRVGTTTWRDSGYTESNIPVGSHTVEFQSITGWNTPANQSVMIKEDRTTIVSGTYTQQVGNLKVILGPSAAVSAGAKWRVDSGAWQNSGDTVTGLSVGVHAVNYKSVAGWTEPPNKSITINNGKTTNDSGTYSQQTGSLKVTISPQGAINAGGQWRRVGTITWYNSGDTESSIPVGSYKVGFNDVTGWNTPANQGVTIKNGKTASTSGNYGRSFFFSQFNKNWASKHLGNDDNNPTIKNAGCALTCAAMVIKSYGVDTDPNRLNDYLTAHGGFDSSGNLDWTKVPGDSGGRVEWVRRIDSPDWNAVDSELKNGYPVIAKVKSIKVDEHFIVIWGKGGNDYYFYDPADKTETTRRWSKGGYWGKYTLVGLRIYHPRPVSI